MFRYLNPLFSFALITLTLILTFNCHADDKAALLANLNNPLSAFIPTAKSAGTIDYKSAYANCANHTSNLNITPITDLLNKNEKVILYSEYNGQKIELTLLSEIGANIAFDELAARKDIPYGFPNGCYARAHKMARILEDRGIIAGKAFAEGEFYMGAILPWGYHVAPVVMVKKGSEIIPYVFDPSLFKKPVPQSEWKAKLLAKKESHLNKEYYTNRFSYDSNDKLEVLSTYSKDSLDEMDKMNKENTKLLNQKTD